jgi:hypothetical protein
MFALGKHMMRLEGKLKGGDAKGTLVTLKDAKDLVLRYIEQERLDRETKINPSEWDSLDP